MSFRERFRDELNFQDIKVKEFSEHTGISQRTIESYLSSREILPRADQALIIAQNLGVTVEYLLTGKSRDNIENSIYVKYRDILDDLSELPDDILETFKISIHASAELQRKKKNPNKDLQA